MNGVLLALALAVCVPIIVLAVECFAALLPAAGREVEDQAPRPRVAVLVPAHNEATGIRASLESIQPQLAKGDRVVVIADNCSDATAAIARALGAIVLERHDPGRIGKSYALDFGLHFLRNDPPAVVLIVDADCIVQPDALERTARLAFTRTRPVQCAYVLEAPEPPTRRDLISAFAFTVKNVVRPGGLTRLGWPCLLTGSGMALPWGVIATVPLGNGRIAEDMWLSVDLALAGKPVLFCKEGRVVGHLPHGGRAALAQRMRWEHGHLETLLAQEPRLVLGALWRRQFDLFALALDLLVPPLSLLVLLWAVVSGLALLAGAAGLSWRPARVAGLGGFLLAAAIGCAWSKFASAIVPLRTLLSTPAYLAWKLPLYIRFFVRRQKLWVRTERE